MPVTLYTQSGSIVNCWVEKLIEVKTQKKVVNELPTANYDYIQNLGTRLRTFDANGGVTGSNQIIGISQLRSLPGTTGSIIYTDVYGFFSIPQTQVFYGDVQFEDTEKEPMKRNFSLSLTEVI